MSDNEILLRNEVMERLRYTNVSAFHGFFNDTPSFPKPFKIGRRNAWYKCDVEAWLEEQRSQANTKQ